MEYLYKNDWRQAEIRLRGLEGIEDQQTCSYLDRVGVTAGWRCLEVGAGAGSITNWLCERVGASGHVVATDIDTRFLNALHIPHLEIRSHDIVEDPLESDAFDLVHLRHVLIHIPTKSLSKCLHKLAASLREGGWILAEESDFATNCAEPSIDKGMRTLYTKVIEHIHDLYKERGMDLHIGLKLFSLLDAAGIDCRQSEGRMRIVRGDSPEADFHKKTFSQLREKMLARSGLSAEMYNDFLRLHNDSRFMYRTRMTVATLGRKPMLSQAK